MKTFVIRLLLLLALLQQISLYSACGTTIEDLVALTEQKRTVLVSGEVRYTVTEGIITEIGAVKLRDLCRNVSFQDSVKSKDIDNLIACDGTKLITRKNTLFYSGDNFVLTEKVPSSAFDAKLVKLAGLQEKDVVFKMSAFNGLYSFLDPFRNQLQLNQTDLPDNYPAESVLSLDLTLANYKNLLLPVPDRTIKINKDGENLTVRFQRSANGHEMQKYTIRDGTIYLTEIDAKMGKSGTIVDKFLLNYSGHPGSGVNIKSPSIIIDITQPEAGPIMFKYYQIEEWIIRKILDTEFLIEAPPGVELIR